jgi:hypothetical protein
VLRGWGSSQRSVTDARELNASVGRYHCGSCGTTFRHYPEGINRASHTDRIRRLGALAWILGLSYREIAALLKERGVDVSHSTLWREGRAILSQLPTREDGEPVRYVIDRRFVRHASPRLGVVIATDLGDGVPQVLGTINSGAPRDVIAWLKNVIRDIDIDLELQVTRVLDGAEPPAP